MKYKLTESIKAQLKSGNVPARELIALIMSNGWKSNKDPEKTSLSDLYTSEYWIKGASLDNDFVHIDTVERSELEVEAVITDSKVYITTPSTIHCNIELPKRRSLESILARIKALRAECRKNGVKFSCISKDDLYKLWEGYVDQWSECKSVFVRSKMFWENQVKSGLYSGLFELENTPSRNFERFFIRSSSISKVESLVYRLNELERENINNYSKVCI